MSNKYKVVKDTVSLGIYTVGDILTLYTYRDVQSFVGVSKDTLKELKDIESMLNEGGAGLELRPESLYLGLQGSELDPVNEDTEITGEIIFLLMPIGEVELFDERERPI